MNEIWANRLVAGTKQWNDVPAARKSAVKAILMARVDEHEVTAEQYEQIVGEDYTTV